MHHHYNKLEVYTRAMEIAKKAVLLSKEIRSRRFSEQILSSAISIPSNIAEGSQRSSNRDFIKFLYYSSGSCAELITQLEIAKETEVWSAKSCQDLLSMTVAVNNKTRALIRSLQKKEK